MLRATLRWLGSSLALLVGVTALTFVLNSLAPGDAAQAILSGQTTSYTPEQYEQMRHQLGIDRSLPEQYAHWVARLFHGDLGTDLFSGQPVTEALTGRLGASLTIIAGTVLVSAVVGVAVGVRSAARSRRNGRLVDLLTAVGLAAPNFWLALVLVELFAVRLELFPATGYTPVAADPAQWLRGIVLPVLTLSVGASAFVARQTRDAMSEVLGREFVTALRARGLPTRSVVYKHALRNAAIPVVTVLGLLFISLLGGAVLIENVFAVPGLGQLAVTASSTHNLPVIEGVAFTFTVVVIVVNVLVDLAYRWLNPKVRLT